MSTEDDVIARIKEHMGSLVAPGAWGFLDDAALLPPLATGYTRIVTTDVVVEGVDFDRTLYPLVYAGARALAQNLSDVAAMGAAPVGFVWSLAVPRARIDDLFELVRGAAALARTRRVPLFGGDLSSTVGPIVCSITAFGDVQGFPVRRSGARVGDDVWLTAPVGASAAGLRRLRQGDVPVGGTVAAFDAWVRALPELEGRAVRAHLRPLPPDGAALAGCASACIDISDGLAKDAHRLAAASAVALDLDDLPLAVDAAGTLADALGGGEDYALLFTMAHGAAPPIESLRIGRVIKGEGVWHVGERVVAAGFDHFG